MIGHHMTRTGKLAMLAWLCRRQAPIKLAVHSRRQAELLAIRLPAVQEHVSVVPYGVDTTFWKPAQVHEEENLVVAAGREHRDYRTLAGACAPLPLHVFVALSSAHTRRPRCALPDRWPANFSIAALDADALRERYARAAVVVVPLLPTDFQAGITSVLEAMAMGKAVVVTATAGLADVLDDEAVCRVPPRDTAAMREAILRLWARPRERARRGRRARRLVEERHSLDSFVAQLATAIWGREC
jgi:glycosyltransferase involved in cell wall biosynthesis